MNLMTDTAVPSYVMKEFVPPSDVMEEFSRALDAYAKSMVSELEKQLADSFKFNPNHDELGRFASGEGWGPSVSGDIVAFHGTSDAVAEQILTEGINVQAATTHGALNDEHRHSVYVAKNKDTAFHFAEYALTKGHDAVVFEVHIPKEAWAKFSPDTQVRMKGGEVAAAFAPITIPPEWIKRTYRADGSAYKADAEVIYLVVATTAADKTKKFNPFHDELGRFAEGPGGGTTISADIPEATGGGRVEEGFTNYDDGKGYKRGKSGPAAKKTVDLYRESVQPTTEPVRAGGWSAGQYIIPTDPNLLGLVSQSENEAIPRMAQWYAVNTYLRTGSVATDIPGFQGVPETLSEKGMNERVATIDKLFDRVSLSEPLVGFRGVKSADFESITSGLKAGQTFTDKGYFPVSLRKGTAEFHALEGGGIFKVLMPKGSKALPLGWHPEEAEVIVNRGSTFRVESIDLPNKSVVVSLVSSKNATKFSGTLDLSLKFNPFHDELGRFAEGPGGTTIDSGFEEAGGGGGGGGGSFTNYDDGKGMKRGESGPAVKKLKELYSGSVKAPANPETTINPWEDNLSGLVQPSEAHAIPVYGDFYNTNKSLRNGDVPANVNKLDGLFERVSLSESITGFRGIATPAFNHLTETYKVGDTFSDKGYAPVSLRHGVAVYHSGDVSGETSGGIVTVKVPKGANALPIPWHKEAEVLINRGAQFKIEALDLKAKTMTVRLLK